jgi:hypothetical protein
LCAVSLAACAYTLPQYFETYVDYCAQLKNDGSGITDFDPLLAQSDLRLHSFYAYVYKLACPLLLYSLLPFIVLIVLTIRISMEIARASHARQQISNYNQERVTTLTVRESVRILSSPAQYNSVRRIDMTQLAARIVIRRTRPRSQQTCNIMLMCVVVKFLFCRLMITGLDVTEKWMPLDVYQNSTLLSVCVDVSNLLVIINGASNFLVYFACSHNFRPLITSI